MSIDFVTAVLSIVASLVTVFGFFVVKNPEVIKIKGINNPVNIGTKTISKRVSKTKNVNKTVNKIVNFVYGPNYRQVTRISQNPTLTRNDDKLLIGFIIVSLLLFGTILIKFSLVFLWFVGVFYIIRFVRYIQAVIVLYHLKEFKFSAIRFYQIIFFQLVQLLILLSLFLIDLPVEYLKLVNYVAFDINNLRGMTTFLDWFGDILQYLFNKKYLTVYFMARTAGIIFLISLIRFVTVTSLDNLPFLFGNENFSKRALEQVKHVLLIILLILITICALYPWYVHDIIINLEEPFKQWVSR